MAEWRGVLESKAIDVFGPIDVRQAGYYMVVNESQGGCNGRSTYRIQIYCFRQVVPTVMYAVKCNSGVLVVSHNDDDHTCHVSPSL